MANYITVATSHRADVDCKFRRLWRDSPEFAHQVADGECVVTLGPQTEVQRHYADNLELKALLHAVAGELRAHGGA